MKMINPYLKWNIYINKFTSFMYAWKFRASYGIRMYKETGVAFFINISIKEFYFVEKKPCICTSELRAYLFSFESHLGKYLLAIWKSLKRSDLWYKKVMEYFRLRKMFRKNKKILLNVYFFKVQKILKALWDIIKLPKILSIFTW